jgi:hypothetical protein
VHRRHAQNESARENENRGENLSRDGAASRRARLASVPPSRISAARFARFVSESRRQRARASLRRKIIFVRRNRHSRRRYARENEHSGRALCMRATKIRAARCGEKPYFIGTSAVS